MIKNENNKLVQKANEFDYFHIKFLTRSGGRYSSYLIPEVGIWNIVFRNETGIASVDIQLSNEFIIMRDVIDNPGGSTSNLYEFSITGIKIL